MAVFYLYLVDQWFLVCGQVCPSLSLVLRVEFKEQMEVFAVPERGQLVWDDFTWLDEPAPVPPDTVTEPPADPLLSAICKGELISDMAIPTVFPIFDQRTNAAGFNGRMPMGASLSICTGKKLVPRKGANAAWLDDMNDIISSHRLLQVATEMQPPTVEQLATALYGFSEAVVAEIHQAIYQDWWAEATRLYHIVRSSIDLGGVFETKDLKTLKATCNYGEYRHGPALLKWALSFTDGDSVAEQAKLISKVESASQFSSPRGPENHF